MRAQLDPTAQQSTAQYQLAKTTILHAHSRYHYWQGSGPLSIKSFPQGQAIYEVAGGRFLLDQSGYLLLNAGQDYTVTVDFPQPVESFCLFFAGGMVDQVYAAAIASPEWLLDNPHTPLTRPLNFYDRCYPHDHTLSPLISQLRLQYRHPSADSGWLEEKLQAIMVALLQHHLGILNEVATLPAQRAVTRDETYRRLYRVRDYIAACYTQPLTLDDMAHVACLSPNHLLRLFKHHFQTTPHQFLRAVRLSAAQKLLLHTELSITELCYAVGFESLGSFSWLFRRKMGLSPEQYRAAKR